MDIASIAGGKIPVDPHSLSAKGQNPASVERFIADQAAMTKLSGSYKIDDISPASYAAVFLPGGHGTMWDLPKSTKLV